MSRDFVDMAIAGESTKPPHAVLAMTLSKDAEALSGLEALDSAQVKLLAAEDTEQARRLIEHERPIAGLLQLGRRPDPAAVQKALALAEMAPRLRLIALMETEALQAPEFSELVSKGLLHDFHRLPICHDRLMFSLGHIAGLVALESRENVGNAGGAFPGQGDAHIVGVSPAITRVFQAIRKFGEVDAPVLGGPFISINCAGLPTSIIESELFGYERGAFTGAIKQKVGRIEAARGGTLFLDEIGDLPLEVQGHLLRFLQEKTIERLGSTKSITVDTRVVAATNINLEDAIKAGKFREDLYYRLNVLCIAMPPLRDRGDDIQLLATYFLRKFSTELKLPKLGFHDSALEKMQRYRWPGNVRELISTIRRAVVMAEGRWIMASDLTFAESNGADQGGVPDLATARQALEEKLMREALRINGGNIKRAAKELGVSRVTLYRMMEKYRIDPDQRAMARVGSSRMAPMPPKPLRPPVRQPANVAGGSRPDPAASPLSKRAGDA
jgi:DNA-binding NtrC family response regulator